MVKRLDKHEVASWFQDLQDRICKGLEDLDGAGTFIEDQWERPEGGGGRSRVILGDLIEKGGVNFSAVSGPLPAKISSALGLGDTDFFATGVSIVLHPKSPHVPIIHMNVRYFDTTAGACWFGGGIDLTPIYIDKDDAHFFHRYLKEVCDAHHSDYYPKFKAWADDYFYLKHRQETRGVGGIFYDRLTGDFNQMCQNFEFTKAIGNAFVPIYSHIADRHRDEVYTESHLEWQALRRSRYVEFNLVWDKGTKFGLDTDGRTESILMSMPPLAKWRYNYQPLPESLEAETQDLLKKGIAWV